MAENWQRGVFTDIYNTGVLRRGLSQCNNLKLTNIVIKMSNLWRGKAEWQKVEIIAQTKL